HGHFARRYPAPRVILAVSAAFAALLLMVVVVPASAVGAAPSTITVSTDSSASFWSGTVYRDGQRIPDVPACATVACDHILLKVTVPDSTWTPHTGGIQVAVRFTQPLFHELGLYVYKDDTLVGSSTAIVGTAQAVLIPPANGSVNGNY